MAVVSDSIKVGVPILLTIVSLLFGAFQYVDKRSIERKLQEQQLRLNAADLIINYLDTDVESIVPLSGEDVVSVTIRWIKSIESSLGVGNIQLQQTSVLLEIERALETDGILRRAPDAQISFLLIRNGGRANAVDVSLTYDDRRPSSIDRNTLNLGVIEPNHSILIPIVAYARPSGYEHPLSAEIKASLLEYTDTSTGRALAIKVRDKFQTPRFIAPRVRLGK
jgi:hypothetical protein